MPHQEAVLPAKFVFYCYVKGVGHFYAADVGEKLDCLRTCSALGPIRPSILPASRTCSNAHRLCIPLFGRRTPTIPLAFSSITISRIWIPSEEKRQSLCHESPILSFLHVVFRTPVDLSTASSAGRGYALFASHAMNFSGKIALHEVARVIPAQEECSIG
jgi:hypothetical protein